MKKKNFPKTGPPVLKLTPEEEQQLDYDICCSIEELESILSKNPSEKQKKLAEVSLKILKNPGETIIKKKQVMRQMFDDYRTKFDGKRKQVITNLNDNKATFNNSNSVSSSLFFRKHKTNLTVNEENDENEKQCVNNSKAQSNIFNFKTSDNSFKFGF